MHQYFKTVSNKISSWELKGLSNEIINFSPQLLNNEPPSPACNNARIKILFSGDFLRQDKVTYNYGPILNFHRLLIVY